MSKKIFIVLFFNILLNFNFLECNFVKKSLKSFKQLFFENNNYKKGIVNYLLIRNFLNFIQSDLSISLNKDCVEDNKYKIKIDNAIQNMYYIGNYGQKVLKNCLFKNQKKINIFNFLLFLHLSSEKCFKFLDFVSVFKK